VPGSLSADELSTYLQDHLAGATGGVSLARRLADEERGPQAEEMRRIAAEIEEDREKLIELMDRLGVSESQMKKIGGLLTEILGRLKLRPSAEGGPILRYESLIMGVTGKRRLWRALLTVADEDPRLAREELERLEARAADQRKRLGELHEREARSTLSA
jgi:hypothetical protein